MLHEMLSYKRPAGSPTEAFWIKKFLEPLGVTSDAFGNLHKKVGESVVLWSCHTDTVHDSEGRQRLVSKGDMISVKRSSCLGADDTAGAWIMSEMIKAGVPGNYIFHREEELMGQGSSFIAYRTPERLEGLKAAIAFDRRGTGSVITHQLLRCCSDKFGKSLASAIGLDHKLDDTGVFTDTANYTDLIGECSNVSVGYYNEHSPQESLNYSYLMKLRDQMLIFDETKLEFSREPGEVEYKNTFSRPCATIYDLVYKYPMRVANLLAEHGWKFKDLKGEILTDNGIFEGKK